MTLTEPVVSDPTTSDDEQFLPAGNLARGLAFLIDALVCLVIGIATIYVVTFISVWMMGNQHIDKIEAFADLFAVLFCCLYFSFSYSSTHQASLGKRALGLIVVTHEGLRLSRVMAIGRVLVPVTIFALGYVLMVGYIFWLTSLDQPGSTESASTRVAGASLVLIYLAFFAPYLMVFFSKKRLTLIDMICKTQVVKKRCL